VRPDTTLMRRTLFQVTTLVRVQFRRANSRVYPRVSSAGTPQEAGLDDPNGRKQPPPASTLQDASHRGALRSIIKIGHHFLYRVRGSSRTLNRQFLQAHGGVPKMLSAATDFHLRMNRWPRRNLIEGEVSPNGLGDLCICFNARTRSADM
jgi:hypothetical protein